MFWIILLLIAFYIGFSYLMNLDRKQKEKIESADKSLRYKKNLQERYKLERMANDERIQNKEWENEYFEFQKLSKKSCPIRYRKEL